MLAQNIQTQGISSMFSLYSGKPENTVAEGGSFEELFQNTKTIAVDKQTETKTAAQDTGKTETGTKGDTAKTATAKECKGTEGKETETKVAKETKESRTEDKKTEPDKATDTVQVTEEEPEGVKEIGDVELAERAAAFLMQIADIVQETLNLSDEQMQALLEELGMTEVDLLVPEQLKNFYLQAKQLPDASALLTDATLLKGLRELGEAVELLAEQFGLSVEELKEQMASPEFAQALDEKLKEQMASPEYAQASGDELEGLEKQEEQMASPEYAQALEEVKQMPEEVHTQHEEPSADEEETAVPAVAYAKADTAEKEVTLSFKTETDSGTDRTLGTPKKEKTRSPEVAQGEQFLHNLQTAAAGKAVTIPEQTGIVTQIREIANQMLEKIRIIVSPGTTSFEIQLTPEHLGRVGVTLTEQDGALKARFVTENELAKEAIESNMIHFKETLNAQGLKVESIEVMVSEFSFDKNGQAGQSGQQEEQKGRHRFAAEEVEESITQPDRLAEHFLQEGESTVNYMA